MGVPSSGGSKPNAMPMASPALMPTSGGGYVPNLRGAPMTMPQSPSGATSSGTKAMAQPMASPNAADWGRVMAYQNGSAGPFTTPQAPAAPNTPMPAPGAPALGVGTLGPTAGASAPPAGAAPGTSSAPTASGNTAGALVRSLFNGQAGLSGVGSQATNADINRYNVGGADYREPSTAVAAMTPQVAQQTMRQFATPQDWGRRQHMSPAALAALPATWAGYANINPAFGS